MHDEIQKEHINLAKKLLLKLLEAAKITFGGIYNKTKNFIKTNIIPPLSNKAKNAIINIKPPSDTPDNKAFKSFVKKYKNQGIYKMQDLDKNLANELAKTLNSYNQDFVKIKTGENKFDIVVTKANASLMDELLPACQKSVINKLDKKAVSKEKLSRAADSITNVVSRAKREANKLKDRHPDRLAPAKHKDIGAI